jgi:hypothetical protein
VHTGFCHGDAVTGLMGAYAVLAALHRRDHDPGFDGEWIDLALCESLFRLVEYAASPTLPKPGASAAAFQPVPVRSPRDADKNNPSLVTRWTEPVRSDRLARSAPRPVGAALRARRSRRRLAHRTLPLATWRDDPLSGSPHADSISVVEISPTGEQVM